MNRALTSIFILFILLYRSSLRLLFFRQCLFSPSCSTYAEEALRRYGAVRGARLSVHRFLRCHPWTTPAVDPVP